MLLDLLLLLLRAVNDQHIVLITAFGAFMFNADCVQTAATLLACPHSDMQVPLAAWRSTAKSAAGELLAFCTTYK